MKNLFSEHKKDADNGPAIGIGTSTRIFIEGNSKLNQWEEILHNFTKKELDLVLESGIPDGYLNLILKCDKTVFVAWSNVIDDNVYKLNRKIKFFKLNRNGKAWLAEDVKISVKWIFRKLGAAFESEVALQWKKLEGFVKLFSK